MRTMMDATRILVVDDDPDILRILKDNLELDGYRVSAATSGKEALSLFDRHPPALVILDLSLPDIDGIVVCRRIRGNSDVPIIILTARDGVPHKVLGLETGADDYMVKPFDYLELAARIKARLRRRAGSPEAVRSFEIGALKIDPGTMTVWKDGAKVALTRRQYDLLLLLAGNRGKPLSRAKIRENLWPDGEIPRDSRAIDVHIQHLRSKIEDNPCDPKNIVTVAGVGYMFDGVV
jgi:DNA-binding response OmpR family regulator